MQVSGLVLYLERDDARAGAALVALAALPSLELGEPQGPFRIPCVLEARTAHGSKDAVRRLEGLVGVERVEVAFVAFAEDDSPAEKKDQQDEEQGAGVQCH